MKDVKRIYEFWIRGLNKASIAPFELVIALLLVLTSVRFLWKEDELDASQIGQTLPVPWLWALAYGIAGLMIIMGVMRPWVKLEAAGLVFMASVVAINAIAFAATYNFWDQWQYGVAFIFYLSISLAALARLRLLLGNKLTALAIHHSEPNASVVPKGSVIQLAEDDVLRVAEEDNNDGSN